MILRKIAGLLFLLGLLSVVFFHNPFTSPSGRTGLFEKILMTAVYPFQAGGVWILDTVKGAFRHYILLVGVSRENIRLKEENGRLKIESGSLMEAIRQIPRVEKLLSATVQLGNPPRVVRVIAFDPFAQFQMITLDQGSDEGVQVRMVALGTGGVAGQVVRVATHSSHVLLITDPNSAVDGVLATTRARVIVRGAGKSLLEGMRAFPMTHGEFFEEGKEILPGDAVMTSGQDGIFPKGLMIGHVLSSEQQTRRGITNSGLIVPEVDIAKLEEVLLIGPLVNQNP